MTLNHHSKWPAIIVAMLTILMGLSNAEAQTFAPDSVVVVYGQLVSGDIDDVLESDDKRLGVAWAGMTLLSSDAPIRFEFRATAPPIAEPKEISVEIEFSSNCFHHTQFISFLNHNTGKFDLVGLVKDQGAVGDVTHQFSGVAADHVDRETGQVVMRHEVRREFSCFVGNWVEQIDFVEFSIE